MRSKKKKLLTKKERKMQTLKHEIAKEIGLENDIKKKGWGELTSRETGKIGGHMLKHLKKKKENFK